MEPSRSFASTAASARRPPPTNLKRNISVLVWHKDGRMEAPVFVADARQAAQLRDAKQVLGSERLRGRARLWSQEERGAAPALVLEPARNSDAGLYTCTLEFKEAPTEIHQMQLELVDPPRNMQIRETVSGDHERPVASGSYAGPFDEQAPTPVTLSCYAEPGSPRAQLAWWQLESSWPIPAGSMDAPYIDRSHSFASGGGGGESLVTVSTEAQPELHYLVASLPAAAEASSGSSKRRLPVQPSNLSLPFQPAVGEQLLASQWRRLPASHASSAIAAEADVDDAATKSSTEQLVWAHIKLTNLTRQHLNQQLLCTAANNNFSAPLNTSIRLDLNLRPSEVRIMNKQVHASFRAHQKAVVECRVFGSKPAPQITWLRGGQPLVETAAASEKEEQSEPGTSQVRISEFSDMKRENNNNNNQLVRISYLSFVPQPNDHQQQLTCSAYNPKLASSAAGSLSDSLVMNVLYPAKLSLQLGASLTPVSILLGTDVFMECHVDSNPAIDELSWLFNGRPLAANSSAGVLIFNTTLVIQKLQISQRGAYQCSAQNSLGKFHSNKLQLKPRFEPVCDYSLTKTKHEIPVNQSAKIECNVLAEPAEGLIFEWQFNQTAAPAYLATDSRVAIGQSFPGDDYQLEDIKQFETNSTRSRAIFRPQTRRHQGQLLCWASNLMGRQVKPCVIQVVTSELPAPVFGCFFDSITNASFSVHCQSDKPQYKSNRAAGPHHQNYLLELHWAPDNANGQADNANNSNNGSRGDEETSSTSSLELQADESGAPQVRDIPQQTGHNAPHNNEPDEPLQVATTDGRPTRPKVIQLTSDTPSFFVTNLQPATNYNVLIYAIDTNGRSPPSFNRVTTLDVGPPQLNPASGKIESQEMHLSEILLAYFDATSSSSWFRMKPVVAVASVLLICSLTIIMLLFFISRSCRLSSPRATNLVSDAHRQLDGCKSEVYDKRKPVVEKNVQLSLCASSRMRALALGNGSDSSRETNTDSTTLSSTTRHTNHHKVGSNELSLDRRLLANNNNCLSSANVNPSTHPRNSLTQVTDGSTLYSATSATQASCSDAARGCSSAVQEARQQITAARCSTSNYLSSIKQHGSMNINRKAPGGSTPNVMYSQMAHVSPQSDFGASYSEEARYLIQCQHSANLNEPIYVISSGAGGCLARCAADQGIELVDPSEHLWDLQQQQHQHELEAGAGCDPLNSYDTTPSLVDSSQNYTSELLRGPIEAPPPPLRFLTSSTSIPVSLGGCHQAQCMHRNSARDCLPELCLKTTEEGGSFLSLSPATELHHHHMTHHPTNGTQPDNHLMYYRVVNGDQQQEGGQAPS